MVRVEHDLKLMLYKSQVLNEMQIHRLTNSWIESASTTAFAITLREEKSAYSHWEE